MTLVILASLVVLVFSSSQLVRDEDMITTTLTLRYPRYVNLHTLLPQSYFMNTAELEYNTLVNDEHKRPTLTVMQHIGITETSSIYMDEWTTVTKTRTKHH